MAKYIGYFNQQWVGDHPAEWYAPRGPITSTGQFLGGMTIIDVATEEEAKFWGTKIGIACGLPQEIRKFKG